MSDTRASRITRIKREIKEDPEEEELACSKRRNTGQQEKSTNTWNIDVKAEAEGESFDEETEGYSDPYYEDDDCSFSDDSGGELCQQRNTHVNGDAGNEELSWEFRSAPDTKPAPLRFKPARSPGPTVDTSSSWTPLSVFQLFCGTSDVRKIVENTNKNGKRQKEAGDRKKWTPITVKDFSIYLTTVLYTSLVRLHKHTDYWKTGWLYDSTFPRAAITRDKYEAIHGALILCDPDKDEENESKKETPDYDKLFKIKPFYTELVNACKAHFQPYSNICVHERKTRKNKPLKCGYRVFALADSLTGYTWNLHIDTGKTAATRGQTAGYTAVKNLLPVSVIGSGYTLYTDGLFSSPHLFTELLDKNIGCCGILSKHHSEFPKSAQNDFPAPQASRGDIRWLRKDKLLFVKWMDTREVAMCSTVHEAFTGQVIKRPVKQGKGWVPKQFSCPDAVADFNRHMVVLGNSGMGFSYCMPYKRVKWHRTMFYHLLDIAVVNSFILYKEVLKLKGDESAKALMQKQFREELCREMLKFATDSIPEALAPSVTCMPQFCGEAERKHCRWCAAHGRKKVKTPVSCRKCQVSLCLHAQRNCFTEWHDAK